MEDMEETVAVSAPAPAPKKKKKVKKKSGGSSGGAGRGKASVKLAESDDDEEGLAGVATGTSESGSGSSVSVSAVVLDGPLATLGAENDTMILDSQETVTFTVEEDDVPVGAVPVDRFPVEGAAPVLEDDTDAPSPTPPLLARTASVESDGGGIDRDLKVKIMNLTQELMSLAEGRKRFKVREYVSMIENAFGLSGLIYRVTNRGSHRTLHIEAIGAVQFVVPHGGDGTVPTSYLRGVVESVGSAAAFAATQRRKR